MSIDFTPGVINTYNGDIYNCTTNTGKNNNPLIPHSLEKDTPLNNLI